MAKKQQQLDSKQGSSIVAEHNRTGHDSVKTPYVIRRRYEEIARDNRYQHFVRIAPRIVRCLDYFGIEFDLTLVRDLLLAYYLFIGVVDEALDFGDLNIGKRILEHFERPVDLSHEHMAASTVELVTEVVKSYTSDENRALISVRLAEPYCEVVREQAATSLTDYIEHRKIIGSRTAELSYILIQDLLRGDTAALCRLMKQVGRVGCLVDSVIDLNMDWRFGILSLKPSAMDRIRLTACALHEGLHTLLRYPSLTGLFLAAIADNVGDPFRTGRPTSPFITAEKKDEVVGVI